MSDDLLPGVPGVVLIYHSFELSGVSSELQDNYVGYPQNSNNQHFKH